MGLQLAGGIEPQPLFWGGPSLTDPAHSPWWLYILVSSGKLFKLVHWSFNVTLTLVLYFQCILQSHNFLIWCCMSHIPSTWQVNLLQKWNFPYVASSFLLLWETFAISATWTLPKNSAASGIARFCQVAEGGEGWHPHFPYWGWIFWVLSSM